MIPEDLAGEKIRLLQVMREELLALRGCLEKLGTLSTGHFSEREQLAEGAGNDPASRLSAHIARIEEIRTQIDELDGRAQSKQPPPVGPDAPGTRVFHLLRQIEEIHRDNVYLAEKVCRQWANALREFRTARRVTAYLTHLKKISASDGWFVDRRR